MNAITHWPAYGDNSRNQACCDFGITENILDVTELARISNEFDWRQARARRETKVACIDCQGQLNRG